MPVISMKFGKRRFLVTKVFASFAPGQGSKRSAVLF
jgi:hypothetical protein